MHERFQFERFENEGVGAEIESQLFFLRTGIARSLNDEGDPAQRFVSLSLAQQRIAVHDRQQQITNDDIGITLACH